MDIFISFICMEKELSALFHWGNYSQLFNRRSGYLGAKSTNQEYVNCFNKS